MQFAARGGGECARMGALRNVMGCEGNRRETKAISGGAIVPSNPCLPAASFANGCEAGPVFLCETTQHDLFAQHPGLHPCSLRAFTKMHEDAGNRMGATKTATARRKTVAERPSITSSIARCWPPV